jgi:hypothetical protein
LHKVYKPNKAINLEIMLIVGDGLSWLAAIALAFIHPQMFLNLLLLSWIITEVLAASILIAERQWWALKYMPLFSFFQFVNVTSYCYSFFRSLGTGGKRLSWNKVSRYKASGATA